MNKAFTREPDSDGRVYCPRCGAAGAPVGPGPMDSHVLPASRSRIADSAWYCANARCDVAYFNQFEAVIEQRELQSPVYPYDFDAPLCACFGLTYDDVEADVREGRPVRIRALVARAESDEARCGALAVDGRSCIPEVQRLYVKLLEGRKP